MSDQTTPNRTARWVKLLLAVSLAINLGIAGLFAGAALRAPHNHAAPEAPEGIAIIARALPVKYQRQLRQSLRDHREDLRIDRAELTGLRNRLVRALRAKPFDIAAVDAVFQDQRAMLDAILATGHAEILKQIEQMSAADRKRFIRNLLGREADARPPKTAPAAPNRP